MYAGEIPWEEGGTRLRLWNEQPTSKSVMPPSQTVPFSFEMVTMLGMSHGPRQPLIVSCTLFSNPLALHSFLSQSAEQEVLAVFQQHPWQIATVR
jgi:hypothetical protein